MKLFGGGIRMYTHIRRESVIPLRFDEGILMCIKMYVLLFYFLFLLCSYNQFKER